MLRKNRTQTILRITRYVSKPGLEIHEVIIGAPLSAWTSPTTESGSTVKSWNKSKKMRSPMPSRGHNQPTDELDGQPLIPPRGL